MVLQTELKERLKRLIRPNQTLRLEKTDSLSLPDSQLQTNFNGLPYFENDERWPINLNTGKPLDFVFQVVNNGLFPWPAYIKVLQFFFDWTNPPRNWQQEGWMVKVYPEITPENCILPNYSPTKPMCSVQFKSAYTLPTWDSIDQYDTKISQIARLLSREHPYEVYDAAVNALIGQTEITSFVGGYPQWIQGEITPTYGKLRSRLLMQIDSTESAEIEWARHGSLFLFYHPLKMHEFSFVLQGI